MKKLIKHSPIFFLLVGSCQYSNDVSLNFCNEINETIPETFRGRESTFRHSTQRINKYQKFDWSNKGDAESADAKFPFLQEIRKMQIFSYFRRLSETARKSRGILGLVSLRLFNRWMLVFFPTLTILKIDLYFDLVLDLGLEY